MSNLPNLSRTAAALAEYDKADAAFRDVILNASGMVSLSYFKQLEELGEAVGEAFGLDTADRNNPETCRQCVRPGPANPSPGAELSFVRRMVAQWQEQ